MPARDEHRRWNVTRLELQAWRNFSRQTEMHFGGRAFFIGPNASGKSNILDALRFLRDVAGEGLQGGVVVLLDPEETHRILVENGVSRSQPSTIAR